LCILLVCSFFNSDICFKTAQHGLGANVYTLLKKIRERLEGSHTIHGNLTYYKIISGFHRALLQSAEVACRATFTDSSSQPVVPYTHTTGSKLRCQTPTKHTTNISEPLRISIKHSSILPDDGSHTIRNMSEWFLILCLLKFLYNVDFNV